MDTGHKLDLYEIFRRRDGHILNGSCTIILHQVTTENCPHSCYKTSSIEVLEFSNFGHNLSIDGEMAAITYMKIDWSELQ